MVFGKTTRTLGLFLVLALAVWFAFDSLAGTFFYSIQGDVCGKLQKQFESAPSIGTKSLLTICVKHEGSVYRAFVVELVTATGLFVFSARGIWRRFRQKHTKPTSAEV